MANLTELQKTDEEIINNFDLVVNLEVLQESEIWDDLIDFVIPDGSDAPGVLESENENE